MVEDILLDECHVCGGVWVDYPAFVRLVRDQDRQASILSLGGVPVELTSLKPRSAGKNFFTVVYLHCPDCNQLMNRKNFGKTSGIIINICSLHGVWFDRDELGQVVQFVKSGGLETSRRRELEELEHQLQEKRFAVQSAPVNLEPISDSLFGRALNGLFDALGHFLNS